MNATDLTEFIRARRQEAARSNTPLKDIRIIDLGSVVPAPFGGTTLGGYGAEVIKIEPPNVPDAIRFWAMVEELGICFSGPQDDPASRGARTPAASPRGLARAEFPGSQAGVSNGKPGGPRAGQGGRGTRCL